MAYADARVSTHSRLKAAGLVPKRILSNAAVSTHSRLKAAGKGVSILRDPYTFQHTAA